MIEEEDPLTNEDLEAAILKLTKDKGNSNSRLLSETKVNKVTVSSRFDVGEFRDAENIRFDIELLTHHFDLQFVQIMVRRTATLCDFISRWKEILIIRLWRT